MACPGDVHKDRKEILRGFGGRGRWRSTERRRKDNQPKATTPLPLLSVCDLLATVGCCLPYSCHLT